MGSPFFAARAIDSRSRKAKGASSIATIRDQKVRHNFLQGLGRLGEPSQGSWVINTSLFCTRVAVTLSLCQKQGGPTDFRLKRFN